jgi:hypothetical protein
MCTTERDYGSGLAKAFDAINIMRFRRESWLDSAVWEVEGDV